MSHYLDNQRSWEWHVTDDKAVVVTDHGNHTHTLDLTNVSIGDLSENTGKTLGDAHRAAAHDYKSEEVSTTMANEKNSFLERIRCDQATIDKVNDVSRNSQPPANRSTAAVKDGGRERGDEGPGSLSRESGLKGETSTQTSEASDTQSGNPGQSSNSNGHGSESGGTTGGQNGGSDGGQNGGPSGQGQ